jgi:uncharacterized protein YcbX
VSATVAWLCVTPVKGMQLQEVAEVRLERHGAHNDRRFVITDERGHLVNGKQLGSLMQLVSICDEAASTLTVRFPDGNETIDSVELGAAEMMTAYGHQRAVRAVVGPWSAALSKWAGRKLRLMQPVDPGDGVDRQRDGGVTLLSQAALDWLARGASVDQVDLRRFRMTIGVAGVDAFTEERWLGRAVRVGAAEVRVGGNVGRCAVTTENPETGVPDLQTLHVLARLRGGLHTTESLPFGVWGEVTVPGVVRVGDPVGASGSGVSRPLHASAPAPTSPQTFRQVP